MSTTAQREPYDIMQNYLLEADERAVFRVLPHHVASVVSMPPRLPLYLSPAAAHGGLCLFRSWLYTPPAVLRCPLLLALRRPTLSAALSRCEYDRIHLV